VFTHYLSHPERLSLKPPHPSLAVCRHRPADRPCCVSSTQHHDGYVMFEDVLKALINHNYQAQEGEGVVDAAAEVITPGSSPGLFSFPLQLSSSVFLFSFPPPTTPQSVACHPYHLFYAAPFPPLWYTHAPLVTRHPSGSQRGEQTHPSPPFASLSTEVLLFTAYCRGKRRPSTW
jgi:hypothetical protein